MTGARPSAAKLAISPATPADVPAIAAMIRALPDYERLAHLCVGTQEELEDALFAPRPAAEVLIARADTTPIGFALFFHTFSTFLARRGVWLEDLFVYPEHRGAGAGKALLKAVAAIARERGCGRFEWAVLDWNAPAIRFYESLGARLMPDWRLARVTGTALERLADDDAQSR
jgi:GNAT superfamily N-acetyltransferase